jgi:hypothetical protein
VKDSQWWRGWLASLVGAMIGLSVAFALKDKRLEKTIFMLCFALAGALLPAQIDFITLWARTTQELIFAASNAVIVIAGSMALLMMNMKAIYRNGQKQCYFMWATMLFATAASAIVLLADPRYRGFPLALYALPAMVSIAVLLQFKIVAAYRRGAMFLSAILVIAAFGMLVQEQINNSQAVILCTYWICIALPAWFSPSLTRIVSNPASKSATAESSGV